MNHEKMTPNKRGKWVYRCITRENPDIDIGRQEFFKVSMTNMLNMLMWKK